MNQPAFPATGGSYTVDAQGTLVQTAEPTRPPKRKSEITAEKVAADAAKATATKSASKAKE
jgi:hypothetical protein